LQNDDVKRDSLYPYNINFFVRSGPRFEEFSYTEHALGYRFKWEIYKSRAGESGILLHRKGKLKSSRLLFNVVVSLPFESILSKMSRYEGDLSDSVVSFI
jgi:hypothetical protein